MKDGVIEVCGVCFGGWDEDELRQKCGAISEKKHLNLKLVKQSCSKESNNLKSVDLGVAFLFLILFLNHQVVFF